MFCSLLLGAGAKYQVLFQDKQDKKNEFFHFDARHTNETAANVMQCTIMDHHES